MTATQKLIDFICDQELDLSEYHLLPPLLGQIFRVIDKNSHIVKEWRHRELVNDIILWEKGQQFASLEKTIDDKYIIELVGELPKKKNISKVIPLPEKDLAHIRKETTHVAGVINREMKQLQTKFPNHRFELSFEFQRLGKRKFYKIHVKTFLDNG